MAWLTGYTYRREITVQDAYVDSNLTDFPAYVPISAAIAGKLTDTTNWYDIRFTQSDGTTLLKYEKESMAAGGGDYWVKVPSILASGGATIYVYYTKSGDSDGSDAENVWDASFEGVYHLAESSDPYLDSTNHNNDSTAGTYPTQATGKIHKGQDFEEGSSEYIALTGSATLFPNKDSWSISCWFKAESIDGSLDRRIISVAVGTDDSLYILALGTVGTDQFQTYIKNAEGSSTTEQVKGISMNTWYYVGLTYDGTIYRPYFAGLPEGETVTDSSGIPHATETVKIGTRVGATNDFFDGVIDEMRISSTPRAAGWIKFEYYNMNEADNELTFGEEEEEEVVYQPRGTSLGRPFAY